MRRVKLIKGLVISLMALLILIGCNANGEDAEAGETETQETGEDEEVDVFDGLPQMVDGAYDIDEFSSTKTNIGDPIDGGEITVAMVSQTAFAGTLNPLFYDMAIDDTIMGWFMEPLLETDESFTYTQDGPATFELSEDNRVYTITIRDNVNWHDGEPVKAEDLEFSYYTLAHPDYDGVRYSSSVANVEGIEEYRNGETDEISGIEVIDDKTIEITLIEASPFLLILDRPIPKHIFEDYDVTEMAEAPETRQDPIGYGPFKVENIVAGESVVLSANEDYWRGDVSLDQVTLEIIPSSSAMQEIRTGGVDIARVPTDQYSEHDDMMNVEVLAYHNPATTFIGFRLGDVDESGEVQPDPDAKMADPKLRQAMWHALDTQLVVDTYYNGLMTRGTTLIPRYHGEYHDESNPGLEFDPDRANELLDEAGFEWVEGEEYRRDQDGEELEIIYAAYQGGDAIEPMNEYYIQAWADVGLNVSLLDGRLHEMNSFYDMLNSTGEDDFDMYHAQIVVGSNPDPSNHRGPTAGLNWSRYQSDASNELLEAGQSEQAFDSEWLVENWNEWQQLMVEEVPDFPTLNSVNLTAVNNRVLNYTVDPHEKLYLHEIQVTEEEPIIDGP